MKIFEVSKNEYLFYKQIYAMRIFSRISHGKFYLKAATYAVEDELIQLLEK